MGFFRKIKSGTIEAKEFLETEAAKKQEEREIRQTKLKFARIRTAIRNKWNKFKQSRDIKRTKTAGA